MNGIILVDKAEDFTSFDVVAILRRLTGTRKIGHAGTLDPMATGVLPVLVGNCTRLANLFPAEDKKYTAVMRLGITTNTEDITGEIISQNPVDCGLQEVAAAAAEFTGEISQVPPMYSAVKKNGVKLYDLARKGIEVERTPRRVMIHSIAVEKSDTAENDYTVHVHSSKGTYIRTLCSDIGKKLGCGAVMVSLRRTEACGFDISKCKSIDTLRAMAESGDIGEAFITADEALSMYPKVTVSSAQAVRFKNGAGLSVDRVAIPAEAPYYRVHDASGLLGLGAVDEEQRELKIKCHLSRGVAD